MNKRKVSSKKKTIEKKKKDLILCTLKVCRSPCNASKGIWVARYCQFGLLSPIPMMITIVIITHFFKDWICSSFKWICTSKDLSTDGVFGGGFFNLAMTP